MLIEEKIEIAVRCGYPAEAAEEWSIKYNSHRKHAAARGLVSDLTFEQYLIKARESQLDSHNAVGLRAGQFVLGRLGDAGPYTVENCRFITSEQNLTESQENGRRTLAGQRCAQTITGRTKDNNPGTAAQADKLAKDFILIDPSGVEHRGRNVFEFCQAHGLDPSAMYSIFAGKQKKHRGWTGQYL